MKKSPEDKLAGKRAAWLKRTAEIFGVSENEARELLSTERRQSLRLNPLVARPEDTLESLRNIGWQGSPFHWTTNGYSIDTPVEQVRDSEAVEKGAAFIQNASSWLPVLALDPKLNDFVLDVCAAPGGKSSHIAALTGNQARLWVNDNSRGRLAKMQATFARLGVFPERMMLYDATQISRKLAGEEFDCILLDAPCSGEGMMQFTRDADVARWSVAHIHRLQQLQKRILTQAWELLKPGGTLVYSTCTTAPEENEAVVDFLLRTRPDARVKPFDIELPNRVPTVEEWNGKHFSQSVQDCLRLAPSPHLEAFFVCRLTKAAPVE
jgi:16S rRNA (cytosine1407-C5)-methyltransferase